MQTAPKLNWLDWRPLTQPPPRNPIPLCDSGSLSHQRNTASRLERGFDAGITRSTLVTFFHNGSLRRQQAWQFTRSEDKDADTVPNFT